ncbi:Ciliary-associated calcium-binding coiled-coil protein 1 [Acropora cervicornis]|uniref:Ciliary-associated calcium-binding coiled-coil protein 1 n=1 Tax=Acropora cervicornis TaxID=6130 RepID=A0AAD9QCA4_ACRCE|nr:Ciliary-associated calcium-binding coiled-coil protein 1 [Acropora cervicornis]
MAEPKKSRSAIRIKSSEKERRKSASKRDSATSRNKPQSEEEAEKESLAWKVLTEEQTQSMKELTVHELEVKLAEVLLIENYHISLPEACILDYYVAGFWYPLSFCIESEKNFSPRFAKEQNFTLQQISAFFTLLKVMLDNIKEKQFSLVNNIQKFRLLLAGIGVENCSQNGGLECFDVNQAKLITDYFIDSFFQHYKLYQFLFTQEPQEEVVLSELTLEVPPLATVPFPPPLDEGMTEEMWREHLMTPPQAPEVDKQEEGEVNIHETEAHSGELTNPDSETIDDLLASIKPEQLKSLVNKAADEFLGNFKVEVETRLRERETFLLSKMGKLQSR